MSSQAQSLLFLCKQGDLQGSREGLGFFLDEEHVVTCAHVVASCLGLGSPTAPLNRMGATIECEFLSDSSQRYFKASLLLYRRALADGEGTSEAQRLSDLALLRVDVPENLPITPRPVRLAEPRKGIDKVVISGAVPDREGKIRITTGTVTKGIQDGRFYVREDPGSNAGPGYSGGPVEHATEDLVLGLVQMAPRSGGDARIIPADVIRDAFADVVHLEVSRAQNRASSIETHQEDLISVLLKAKDRQEQDDQIIDAVSAAFDSVQNHYKLCVALLQAPPESCPDVFRSRLADRRFSSRRDWGARPTWCEEWAPPSFRLDLGRAIGPAFEWELNDLLEMAGGIGDNSAAHGENDVRAALVHRVGLVIFAVRASSSIVAAHTDDLRAEVERWIAAHARANRPPFCLLLIFEQPQLQRVLNLPFFRRRRPDNTDAVLTSLSTLPGLVVRRIDPLRDLRAELDLDKWISRTWMALKKRGHEPKVIRARTFEKTYDSSETKDITFWQWQRRLDDHSTEIFRGTG
jgi:hypothetical protein